MINDTSEPQSTVLGLFDPNRTQRLAAIGRAVLRYGLVALLLLWGTFKFAAFEAEGIRPLVEHSPLLRWMYPLLGLRGTSSLIGVIELSAALLMCMRRWRPALSAVGSLLAAGTFLVTLSFLFTTPGVLAPTNPFGGFLMKDIMLLGAALYTAAEALEAASQHPTAAQLHLRKEIPWTTP
jgi:uncharacterized membrane protein YkgB